MIPLLDPPPCATCRHDAALHINGTNQCGYRVDGEYRCVCDGYQAAPL